MFGLMVSIIQERRHSNSILGEGAFSLKQLVLFQGMY